MSRLTVCQIGLAALVLIGLGVDPADLSLGDGLLALLQVADWLTRTVVWLALFAVILGPVLPLAEVVLQSRPAVLA